MSEETGLMDMAKGLLENLPKQKETKQKEPQETNKKVVDKIERELNRIEQYNRYRGYKILGAVITVIAGFLVGLTGSTAILGILCLGIAIVMLSTIEETKVLVAALHQRLEHEGILRENYMEQLKTKKSD